MYTSGYANRSSSFSSASSNIARVSSENATAGLISEVVYREDQPMMTQLLLLPCSAVRAAIALAAVADASAKIKPGVGAVGRTSIDKSHAN
jgi:hypothetical protein